MSFQTAIARDATYIHTRDDGEFNVEIKFWAKGLDPDVATATSTTRGTRAEQANDRDETAEGESEVTHIIATVTQAAVTSVDEEGWMAVDGIMYSIRSVSGADGVTWRVSGEREHMYSFGDATRYIGR